MIETAPRVPLVAPQVGEAEIAAVTTVLRSGQLAGGPQVMAFEGEFAALVGVAHAVALNSGTAANHAALDAFGIGEGDEVLSTPFTFAASATPILMQRAIPRFVDIDARTFNLDPSAARAAAGAKTRAAVLVDLFGCPIEPNGVRELRECGVRLLEDACQAVGAKRDGRAAGSLCEAGSFSFYATKNIMTGEGGMLVSDDADVAERARRFRHHGQGARYEYLTLGYNYRMTDITAAIGRSQLARLPAFAHVRRTNAAFYDAELAGIEGVSVPFVPVGVEHAYHQYSLLIDGAQTPNGAARDDVRAALAARNIESGIYYPKPLHLHPLFAAYGYGPGDFPIAERVSKQIVALPIGPHLDHEQLAWTVRSVRAAVGAPE
ncbi:MAG: DegT/DnrJ/EryC1/StrS family aminotransferase [Candidatus Eremiobacteraeota bacterium]|nr:DegT/DnrJ/EryC1/StrS family aminotransferase [Candidatus Eremiobacteraeota bacterium]